MTAEMRDPAARIDLAHVAEFTIGALAVRPATREVTRDGQTEVLEPRVMQVLVALARAGGGVVSRDDLTRSCWEGRIVGEDAINRVISRLRRVGETIGQDSFRVETVTKVGYRLVVSGATIDDAAGGAAAPFASTGKPSRRSLVGAAAAVGATALAGGLVWRMTRRDDASPSRVTPLLLQAELALQQDSADGNAQAIGLYRRVVELEPGSSDGWGGLALAYANASQQSPPDALASMRDRARAASNRARAIDPDNAYAQIALAVLMPRRGNWLPYERTLRHALREHSDSPRILAALSQCLADVGRFAEAATMLVKSVALGNPSPVTLYERTLALWAANRLEEADRSSDEMFMLYPRHVGVWFIRLYLLMFTGRIDQAIAMAMARAGRPPGIPDYDFDIVLAAAYALRSKARADIDTAMRVNIQAAHNGAGYADNALLFACALGRLDDAFMLADAVFFSRGFDPGNLFFSEQQGAYLAPGDRLTSTLFQPVTAVMRADPRFELLVGEIGLKKYWDESGSTPDYKA
jgi:DNA-binding winged helix-turn-helix (wHTH) protein/tetratricopeptide (TPR) repeat protein